MSKKNKTNRTSGKKRKSIQKTKPRRRRYTDEEKRAAVGEVAELGLSSAARKHDLPLSTLHAWTKSPQWTQATKRAASSVKSTSTKKRRFTDGERKHALGLVVSGMSQVAAAKAVGTTPKSIREWFRAAQEGGTLPTQDSLMNRANGDHKRKEPEDSAKGIAVASEPKPTSGSLYAPQDPGQGLSDIETAAILELKKKYPSMGPAQIRAQLKRFKGWRVSIKAIARVLRKHGYELVHCGSRPQGPEPVRFEAPRRNALWQMD